jgi:hypothetical protein
MELQVGTTIGDYQIVGNLGAGGMGKVFKVRNVISDRVEAMKVLLPDLASDHELADRFMREIKVQASLEHPNIASLHTALRVDNQLLMLMEFVEGVTLEHKLKDGPLPVASGVDYIAQVLAALEYAHKHGVVHRDIKPANMMLTNAGVIKLMDFGIAKAKTDQRLTMTGTTMGSLYYMSPEQIQGAADLDARADLYSVGVSLYELVTGKRPFDGDSQFAIMSAHLEKQPVPPITLDPKMPKGLNDAILMAVAKDPNARFQTAGAFRAALLSVAGSLQPVAAAAAAGAGAATPKGAQADDYHLIEPTKPEGKGGKRGLWMAAGAVAAVLAVVGVIQFGPGKGAGAAPQLPAQTLQQTPAQTPVQTPIQTPVQTPQSTPPPTAAPMQQQPQPRTPITQTPPVRPPAQPARQNTTPVVQPPQQNTPAQQTPVQQPPVTQAQQQQPVQTPPSRPAVDGKVREDLMLLQTRARTVSGGMQRLQTQQAASGLGMRSDMQTAHSSMTSYLQAASDAVNAGDAAAAKGYMEKAERQIEKLEKWLGM